MGFIDQLTQLHALHERGALSDEEFALGKARLLKEEGATPAADPPQVSAALASLNALRRSRSDRWIAGVCGGIARATGMEAWLARLLFALFLLCGGFGLLIYLLLWIFVPAE